MGGRYSTTKPPINILTATASDLGRLLDAGEHTSADLVQLYLDQIDRHNVEGMCLRAIIETAPREVVLETARSLDEERARKGPRGPLHGIPVIVKDQFCTPSFGMGTTCGSLATKGLKASRDASVVIKLSEAGCILIGKTNMSEWGNNRGDSLTAGWSAAGGQCQSPYVRGGVDPKDTWMGHSTPGGSSSGSAAGTAAGFAPFSVGTEADGSLTQPSIRAGLYCIKATAGSISPDAAFADGSPFTGIGPIAKSVQDCADVLGVLQPGRNFRQCLRRRSWKGIGVAAVDYDGWFFDESICARIPEFDDQMKSEMSNALARIRGLGARVKLDPPLLRVSEIEEKYEVMGAGPIGTHNLRGIVATFLALFDDPKMRTLKDVVDFNRSHAGDELPPDQPSQSRMEAGLEDTMTDEECAAGLNSLRTTVRMCVDECLRETGSDVIMSAGECLLTSVGAASGYPIAAMPLGISKYNGRPFGVLALARAGQEEKLIEIMAAWEATFPEARVPPPMLVDWRR